MNRAIRTLLGVTATAGIVVLGVPALSSAASASTTSAAGITSTASASAFEKWGPYYSANELAWAKGTIRVESDEDTNTVDVKGKLHDEDERTLEEGGKCACVEFNVNHFSTDHE